MVWRRSLQNVFSLFSIQTFCKREAHCTDDDDDDDDDGAFFS
jgi:hypothetical protein